MNNPLGKIKNSVPIESELKFIFKDKLEKESARFDPKRERILSQRVIPIERFDPSTGKSKVVDVKVINYVVTKDGKIHVVFEGETSPDKLKKEGNEEKRDKVSFEGIRGDMGAEKGKEPGNPKTKVHSLEREKAMTYVCSNGETNDGLVTKLTPTESLIHVNFHEQQHLIARNIEAFLNDERVFLEYIRLYTRVDPATGKIYVAGGRAVTIKGKITHPRNLSPRPWQSLQVHISRALS